MLTRGNVAKLFCLEQIDQLLTERQERQILLDLGCGTAQNFIPLLRKHPHVRYVGWDINHKAIEQAKANLVGLNAEVHHGLAYEAKVETKANIIVSFSTFEHVYQREKYLCVAKENLAPEGIFFINYDSGHFFLPPERSFWLNQKNLLANRIFWIIQNMLVCWVERNFEYQSFVREQEFRSYLQQLGFKVLDEKMFNTQLKSIFKLIPEQNQDDFMKKWLEMELWINQQELFYSDHLACYFMTRNFILTHA